MRWEGQRESENVEDRRGAKGPGMVLGGGIGTLVLIVLALVFGIDPRALLGLAQALPQGGQQAPAKPAGEIQDEQGRFVKVILASTEDAWGKIFTDEGRRYEDPYLELFTGATQSGCGYANAAVGPFYCPADDKVYLDLSFFQQLEDKLDAPGDFARAYVIAHEVGHHVQDLLGITDQVDSQRGRISTEEQNALSVRLELQADYLAGVWAHHARKQSPEFVEDGDIDEALQAASAIGDDTLQKESQGYAVPDSFTHGTSEQRVRWFRRGLDAGDLSQGDTFNARRL